MKLERFATDSAAAIVVLTLVVGGLGGPVMADDCAPLTLLASDGAGSDMLGASVAVDGDTMVLGAANDNNANGVDAGAAYVYRWDGYGWVEEAKLIASDGQSFDAFGRSVAIEHDTILVGASTGDAGLQVNAGVVYVFTRMSGAEWIEVAKLAADDADSGAAFGDAVAIRDGTAVVGAPRDQADGLFQSGSAYVFARGPGGWGQTAKLTASDAAVNDQFGVSVAIDAGTIVVGALFGDGAAPDSGSAYVFVGSNGSWGEQDELFAAGGQAGEEFGASVDVGADTVVVGAPFSTESGLRGSIAGGSAYVFDRAGGVWAQTDRLLGSDAEDGDEFGASVALDGETVIVGSPGKDGAGSDSGALFAFDRVAGIWGGPARIDALDGEFGDRLGAGVALQGGVALAGAPLDNGPGGADQGSARVLQRIGGFWIGPDQRITPADADDQWQSGAAVDIDGSVAVIGAPGADTPAANSAGAVYVYVREGLGWVLRQELFLVSGGTDDQFGASVAVDEGYIIVGAPNRTLPCGSAFIFGPDGAGWVTEPVDLGGDICLDFGQPPQRFGEAVDLDFPLAVVGEPLITGFRGRAHVFRESIPGSFWTTDGVLLPPSVDAGDNFGASVAIDGSTVIVGAPGYGPLEEGGAFMFERSSPVVGRGGGPQWLERATLQPPNPDAGSLFGASVALQDGLALVGAPDEDVGTAENAGIVHLFEGQGPIWEWIMRLASPAPEFQGGFGTALALDGARIVVGAPNEGPTPTRGSEGPGAAHLFVRAGGSWIFRTSFEPDAQAPGIFGDAVAVSGQHAAVGDPWYNLPTRGCCSDQGQTAFFTVSDECLDPLAVNVTKSLIYPQLPPALDEASPFDFLEATDPAFRNVPSIATGGVPLFLESTGAIRTPSGTSISLSASSLLATAPGHDASFYGPVSVGAGASVIAGSTLTNAQSLSLLGGTLAPLAGVSNPGAIIGFGQIDASVRNPGSVTVQADLVVTGDYTNAGLTTIQSGTLTVLGELTNTGSIVGDAESVRGESAGLFADAGLVSGAGAILMLPNGSTLTVGGDADCAIDDNDRFDLATSTVRMAGVGGTQRMESMSADIGADPAGLDRTMDGHYPLGALRVGPTPTTVSIVDAHDNDGAGQGGCEAVYVGQLRIDAGATLLTGGCRVYYQSLVLNGDVDDPGNLVQISASCGVADLAEPLGELNFSDVFAFLVAFGSMGPAADLAAPFGVFDFSDVFAFLVAFGAGCP